MFLQSGHTAPSEPASSLLLLIDVSGSMGDEIGSGNSDIKIEAAKEAAAAAVRQAARKGTAEVAVLAFEGDCARPVSRRAGFSRDFDALEDFIASLRPGGGTPMAEAVLLANRFMQNQGAPKARDRMIVLLADGQNDCGNVGDALAELKAAGVIFRHETVGFGIEPDSGAARDLRDIATASGGAYHHAADATQLGDLFVQFVDTFTVIDMLGMFGKSARGTASSGPPGRQKGAQPPDRPGRETSLPPTPQAADGEPAGEVTALLGQFKPKRSPAPVDDPPPSKPGEPGAVLCYRQFGNPSGLEGVRNGKTATEFTCAPSCGPLDEGPFGAGQTIVRKPEGLGCEEQCAYAAGDDPGAAFVVGRSLYENHCVPALDPLRPPAVVVRYYCDLKDNKHRLAWERGAPATGGFRAYLNHYPERNDDAEFLGAASGGKFDFEYGIDFHSDPVVDGLNLWNPFPRAGVSACNKYGICTPVVYGDVVDDCESETAVEETDF